MLQLQNVKFNLGVVVKTLVPFSIALATFTVSIPVDFGAVCQAVPIDATALSWGRGFPAPYYFPYSGYPGCEIYEERILLGRLLMDVLFWGITQLIVLKIWFKLRKLSR